MLLTRSLETQHLILRNLTGADATETYAAWLRDPRINRYLEVRFAPPQSPEDLASFIADANESEDTLLLGMFPKAHGRHIGNIKLGPINPHYRRADIGLLIGDETEWGKGYGREAIAAIADYGLTALRLAKITAGCYAANQGSYRAFLAAGFHEEARLAGHRSTNGEIDDEILLALHGPARAFASLSHLVLIGGGVFLRDFAHSTRAAGFETRIILAPRHAAEIIQSGITMAAALQGEGFQVDVLDDINAFDPPPGAGPHVAALCLGPAWIFSTRTRSAYGAGMYNFNFIPVPRYLGGAHFTWQILNRDRKGGCIFQEITGSIDRGPILRAHYFDLPSSAVTPQDYFNVVGMEAARFCRAVIDDMRAGKLFPATDFASLNADRLYFPRLLTIQQGWIDWSWPAEDIALFCQAFDDPYAGASTMLGDRTVRLKGVSFESGRHLKFHPFAAGLIVRKAGNAIGIAARGGLLNVRQVEGASGEDPTPLLKEGSRFITPAERLSAALSTAVTLTPRGIS